MNRYFLLTLIICFSSTSITFAQGGLLQQLGRELGIPELQQQGGRQGGGQQGGDQPQLRSALPSEGGRNSGGQDFQYSDGEGFWLGDGGQQGGQPGYGGQPIYGEQPRYGSQPHDSRRYHNGGQPFYSDGRTPYSGGMNATNPGIPSSPVMSNQYVMIRCPSTTVGSLTYTLAANRGQYRFTLSGGQEQRFQVGANWTIGYHDGTQQRLYKLEGGKTYTLTRQPDNRWQLYVVKSAGS